MAEPKVSDDAYRGAARMLMDEVKARVPHVEESDVGAWATVQRVEGGAFVDVTVFIPEKAATGE